MWNFISPNSFSDTLSLALKSRLFFCIKRLDSSGKNVTFQPCRYGFRYKDSDKCDLRKQGFLALRPFINLQKQFHWYTTGYLVWQDILGLSCTTPAPDLELAISSKSPNFLSRKMVFKNCDLDARDINATKLALLSISFQSRWENQHIEYMWNTSWFHIDNSYSKWGLQDLYLNIPYYFCMFFLPHQYSQIYCVLLRHFQVIFYLKKVFLNYSL